MSGFDLEQWGASRDVLDALERLRSARGTGTPGRVSAVDRTAVSIVTPQGVLRATGSGIGPLCVGDWVLVGPGDAAPHEVLAVLERRSAITRSGRAGAAPQTLAANVDDVLITVALDQASDPSRLERLLTLAWDSGAAPRILLTKSDLADAEAAVATVQAANPGAPVAAISARTGLGIGELLAYLGPGRTAALVGSSGAGKSSLVNALVGSDQLRVGTVRARDGKGRHTTSRRELVALPSGGAIIDTPGIRSLGLWLDEGGLETTFSDIAGYAEQCKFRDCCHATEPGCAVQRAIAEGKLDGRRLESYSKLQAETETIARRQDERAARAGARTPPSPAEAGRSGRPRPR